MVVTLKMLILGQLEITISGKEKEVLDPMSTLIVD